MPRSWLVVAVACGLGCAGRSEVTSAGDGASSTAGSGGAGGASGTIGSMSATGGMSMTGSMSTTDSMSVTSSTSGTAQAPSALPQCLLPAVTGTCQAYFERWAFNPSTLECEQFV